MPRGATAMMTVMAGELAGDFDYDAAKVGYAAHRRADPRIAALVHAALGDARTVINVGAGAGSYEPTDRVVTAVEPSAQMRAERPAHLARAIDATAEDLPFPDDAFDAAMATVTIHQWRDVDRGLRELRRVSRGPVVILTFDRSALGRLWLEEYVPELFVAEAQRYPDINRVCAVLGGAHVVEVPVPFDCTDGVTEAYYGRPELFLDPSVRRAQSAWGFVPDGVEERFERALRADLDSGEWDRRHGHLRGQPSFLGAMRLILAEESDAVS
jgi:SAM-dependent methyltransferase